MTQPYVMAYYIPLFILWLYALSTKNKDYAFITSVIVVAFAATRLITFLPEAERIMLDFANDLAVCAALIYFQKKKASQEKNKVIPFLIITYIGMMICYILNIADIVTHTGKMYMLEAISVVQLLLIFGGMIHGTRRHSNNTKHISDIVGHSGAMHRDKMDERHKKDVERKKSNVPFKSGDHASLAEDS